MPHASREARSRTRAVPDPVRPGLAGRGLRLACILAGDFTRSRRTMASMHKAINHNPQWTPPRMGWTQGGERETRIIMNTLPTETVSTTHQGLGYFRGQSFGVVT
jgi:hypothetical protein